VLNSLIFILIGLQLPRILADLHEYSWPQLLGYALAVSAAAIAIRMLWVFPGAYLPHLLSARVRRRERRPPWQQVTLVGWCGMRGIVSLAAALALPIATADGAPLPGRELVIFLTFTVIVATLVIQGLSLRLLIRKLKIGADWGSLEEERMARTRIAEAALQALPALAAEHAVAQSLSAEIRAGYEERIAAAHPAQLILSGEHDHRSLLRMALLNAERRELIRLWRDQRIGDETLHEIERELDLEESRLG
jgi:monovalent cation/hydrogen antiporter